MKKKLLTFVAFSIAIGCKANNLRVNNVDPSAPFATIAAAEQAAAEGDTIMVEGTSVYYEETTINKRLVIIGPGYWLRENGIATESAESANIQSLTTKAEGTVVMGVHVRKLFRIEGAKTIVTRCCLEEGVSIMKATNNCIITQNFIGGEVGSGYDRSYYHQITNNVCGSIACKGIGDSYIAYNTSFTYWGESFWNSANCKIEKNIFFSSDIDEGEGNTIRDNYIVGKLYKDINTDKDVRDTQLSAEAESYGAFAGSAPYVISGIPAGPMIENLTIPMSAEEGGTFKAIIKFGEQSNNKND